MAFERVYSLAKLPADNVVEVVAGKTVIALCNAGGEVRAIGGICPHQGGPLGEGAMNGDNVVCPWHAWEFNSKNGQNDFDPDTLVPTYAVRVDGDDILIDVTCLNSPK